MSDDQQHDKEDELGRDGDASPDEEDAPEGLEAAEESVSEEREVQDQFVGARAGDEPADVTAGFTTSVTEAHVADLLTEIGESAAKCGLKSLEREVVEERLPALSRGRITLVVLGEFNHGKSTVVNALLGDAVLPVGITPTTAVITHLVYAEEASVTVRPPHDGEPFEIGYDEMERAVKESGDEGEEPELMTGVQRGDGCICDEKRGFSRKGTGAMHAGELPAREGIRVPVCKVLDIAGRYCAVHGIGICGFQPSERRTMTEAAKGNDIANRVGPCERTGLW